MKEHYITWWNIENLFDEKDAPLSRRSEKVKRKIAADLSKWTSNVLTQKIENLASVINQINGGQGPDIMGLCEVENDHVLHLLLDNLTVGRNYKVLHHDMSDNRGIDVAFIYDEDKYEFQPGTFFHYPVIKRYPTREIVQSTLKVKESGVELVLLGNHWPSRSGGQYKSEPYRILTAETLSYFMERILEIKGKDAAVIVMGDFNDEPHNRSITDYALSTMDRQKVVYARSPMLYNLMWELMGTRKASYVFDNAPMMIDQFMVSKGIAKKSGKFDLDDSRVILEIFDGMVDGRYSKPVRFGQKSPNLEGFSDHLPVSFLLKEK